MNRMTLLLLISLMYSGLNIAIAQDPPPRPDKYFVPFSAPQNFIELPAPNISLR